MNSQSTSPQQLRTELRGANDVWTIPLPARLKSDDQRLRDVVANLLALAGVRSVVVDGERTAATVVFRPNRSAAIDVAEIPTSVFVEPVDEAKSDSASRASNASIVSWTDANNRSTCFIRLPASAQGWRRVLLLAAAAFTLALGLAGIVLPGLPTTPFVLVASYCLLRSSPALHGRLLHSRLFGGVLRDWYLHRGLRPHVRYKAIAVVVIVLGASLLLTSLPLAAKLTIVAIAAIGIGYVWRLPSIVEQVSSSNQ
jgi:uncharacterized membrane protein YbaN (DUF454 family)